MKLGRKGRKSATLALAWLWMAVAAPAMASKSASFEVSLRLVANCSVGVDAIDLGQKQGAISSEISASGAVRVACTDATPYTVAFDAGTGLGSSLAARYLSSSSGERVQFNLYGSKGSPSGATQGVDTESGVGDGAAQTIQIEARVPIQKTPSAGDYRSTLTATVYF